MVALSSLDFHAGGASKNALFVSGPSGTEIKVKSRAVVGLCAEPGETMKQKKFDTRLAAKVLTKSIHLEIERTDWGKKVDAPTPDKKTLKGRQDLYFGTHKGMPGGNLWKCEIPKRDVESCVKVDINGRTSGGKTSSSSSSSSSGSKIQNGKAVETSVDLKLKKSPSWSEKLDATFGPWGGRGTAPFDPVQDVCKSTHVTVKFPSDGAALAFQKEVVGNESASSGEKTAGRKRGREKEGNGNTTDSKGEKKSGSKKSSSEKSNNRQKLSPSSLVGATVVFTGEPQMGKVKAGKEIEKAGGKVVSAVSGKTTFLVCGDSGGGSYAGAGFSAASGSKATKAKELNSSGKGNIRILTEKQFLGMIGGGDEEDEEYDEEEEHYDDDDDGDYDQPPPAKRSKKA